MSLIFFMAFSAYWISVSLQILEVSECIANCNKYKLIEINGVSLFYFLVEWKLFTLWGYYWKMAGLGLFAGLLNGVEYLNINISLVF